MGIIQKSFQREIGKNAGKVVSNIFFGDMHSTPYRRVGDNSRSEAIEAKNEQQRKERIFAIDSAVLKNIDSVASLLISNDKTELLQQLAELEIQLKVNKWHETLNSEENQVRNKYCDALFEKYKQTLRTLKVLDPNESQINYFEKIKKRTLFSKIIRTYPTYLAIALFFIIVWAVIGFNSLDDSERISLFVLLGGIIFIGILFIIFLKIRKKNKVVKSQQSESIQSKQTKDNSCYKSEQGEPLRESIFIDLNKDNRIQIRLSYIWERYNNSVDKNIITRRPVFSADGVKDSILFIGVNPSYNPNDDRFFVHSSDDTSLMYGSLYQLSDAPDYFQILERFASKIGKAYSHINLLYAQENDRELLLQQNHNFIREQLEVTYETILKIQPVAIVFFTDYCKNLIFGPDRWVNPSIEQKGSYVLNGTDYPVFFANDITAMSPAEQNLLSQKIKLALR